jgi:hypothetical protein
MLLGLIVLKLQEYFPLRSLSCSGHEVWPETPPTPAASLAITLSPLQAAEGTPQSAISKAFRSTQSPIVSVCRLPPRPDNGSEFDSKFYACLSQSVAASDAFFHSHCEVLRRKKRALRRLQPNCSPFWKLTIRPRRSSSTRRCPRDLLRASRGLSQASMVYFSKPRSCS